jgi:hypothetical protein
MALFGANKTTSRKTYTPDQWQPKIDAIKVSKTYVPGTADSDLNVLIMNYLVHEGYPSAAVSFAREASLTLSKESVESITIRREIRNKIHAGDIESAIHDINTLNPQVSPAFTPDVVTGRPSRITFLIATITTH